ncbi:MAG: 4Fe-4S dicluster domain-containing protein [Candidatus Hydrogenedentota bacterium]|nr:MAG: 4Fe-4S dicluster domain-containing protein [Candidatus Hydrogenedentota bacterium]
MNNSRLEETRQEGEFSFHRKPSRENHFSTNRIRRRDLFISLGTALISFAARSFGSIPTPSDKDRHVTPRYLRPPGTENEAVFLSRCIRCRACANVCEAGCIRFFTFAEGTGMAGTPYLRPRLRSCNLCMNCTNTCPTAALEPIPRNFNDIASRVSMGVAVVIRSNCLSFNGRVCGICHDACPLKGKAIRLKPVAKPVVDAEYCIGCGRCEERCPQFPAAIIVKREHPEKRSRLHSTSSPGPSGESIFA